MIMENCIRALKKLEMMENGQHVGAINLGDCEDCVNEGWADAVPGGYKLTEKGRKLLEENA